MNKRQTETAFIDVMQLTMECAMCGYTLVESSLNDDALATKAWNLGWRVQDWQLDGASGEGSVLCQHCTDDKR